MFEDRKLEPRLLNADPCSAAHVHVIHYSFKKILPVKILATFIVKNGVLLAILGQQAPQASFGKVLKHYLLFSFFILTNLSLKALSVRFSP